MWDIKFLFANPDVEFLNTGPGRDIFSKESRSFGSIVADARRGAYELVFAGNNAFPYFNPRKNTLRNCSNWIWKVLCHPNLLKGRVFPYAQPNLSLVGIDMEDRPVIDNRWFHILKHSACFFKRELPQNPCNAFLYTSAKTEDNGNVLHSKILQSWIKKLRPISLGVEPDVCRQTSTLDPGKKTDVFFAGELQNRPNRLAGIKQLERLKTEGFAVDIAREKLPREEFLRRCAQAYIVWSPEGYGWDCFRHYEVALAGSVPLIQSPTINRYAPLMDDEHAIYYYVESDHLAVRVRQALQNRQRLAGMGQAARQYVLKWHTHEALSRYVIEESKRTLAERKEKI
jgi:Glycosyl transferases group 1